MMTFPLAARRGLLATAVLAGLTVPARSLFAQMTGTVEGTVRLAESNHPVEAARVAVEGTELAALTDAQGRFRLTGVPAGLRVLSVTAIQRKPLRVPITVPVGDSVTADLEMVASPIELAELVITATRAADRRAEVPATVGVIERDAIAHTNPHHPAELMRQVPGVLVIDLGGEGHTTAMRQPITYNAVYSYLEDGIPIRSTGFFNHNALYEVNIPAADRVEVFKGPGSALYGSDAIGGVVNVLTRAPSSGPSLELLAEGGSFGYARTLASGSAIWGGNGLRADLNLTHYSGYRHGTHQDRQSGTLRWDRQLGAGAQLKTVLGFSSIDSPGDGGSELVRADYEDDPTRNYTPIAFRKVKAVRWSTGLERRTGAGRLSLTGYARYNELALLPAWQLTYDPEVWQTSNYSLGLLAQGRRDLAPLRTTLIAGLDLDWSPGQYRSDSITVTRVGRSFTDYAVAARLYQYDVTFTGISPYLQADLTPLPTLRLSAGLRYDHLGYDYENHLGALQTGRHRRPASTTRWFDHVSPKLGATVAVTPAISAFASWRHGFRVPSQSQLFRQGSALNTVNLDPIRANSYEIGMRARAGDRLSLEISAYTMTVTDDILTFFNTVTFTSETSNAGETRHRGLEVGAQLALASAMRLEGAYSYARHEYRRWSTSTGNDFGGNDIESAPRHLANTRLVVSPVRGVAVTIEWQHLGSYFTDPANQHRYDGHDLFNVYFDAPVTRGFALVGRVNNLANTRNAVTASYNPFVAPADRERFRPGLPRAFYLGAQYRWSRR